MPRSSEYERAGELEKQDNLTPSTTSEPEHPDEKYDDRPVPGRMRSQPDREHDEVEALDAGHQKDLTRGLVSSLDETYPPERRLT